MPQTLPVRLSFHRDVFCLDRNGPSTFRIATQVTCCVAIVECFMPLAQFNFSLAALRNGSEGSFGLSLGPRLRPAGTSTSTLCTGCVDALLSPHGPLSKEGILLMPLPALAKLMAENSRQFKREESVDADQVGGYGVCVDFDG